MKLTNEEYAKEVRARVSDLNDLLAESSERDITIVIEQRIEAIHEVNPVLYITTLAGNL